MTTDREYLINNQLPLELARMIGKLVYSSYVRALDPCVGDGVAFQAITGGWRASSWGIEPEQKFSGPARSRIGYSNFLAAQFEDCVVKGFPLAYINMPVERRREINWIKRIYDAMIPGGIAVWILPEKVTKNPEWLTKFSNAFGDTEVFRFPDQFKGQVSQLIIRTRPRLQLETDQDLVRIQMLVEACEKASVLPNSPLAWQLPAHIASDRTTMVFKVRALEWQDVLKDLMDVAYPHITETLDLPLFSHFEDYKRRTPEDTTTFDPHVSVITGEQGLFQVWVDAYATYEKEIMFLSLVGRLAHIRILESILKGGKAIKLDFNNLVLDGKMRHWRKMYQNLVYRLPISGAYQSLWIHTNTIGKMSRVSSNMLVPDDKPLLAAKIIAGASGLPMMPEWVELAERGGGLGRVYGSYGHNVNASAKTVHAPSLALRMTNLAKNKELPEPTPGQSEIIRPLMPPTAGGYAQLALQQFINNYPLEAPGGDKFVLYAKPMIKEDTDISDVLNEKVEITTVTRKDAVHVELFHYAGPRVGEWESFETGAEYEKNEEEEEEPDLEEEEDNEPDSEQDETTE